MTTLFTPQSAFTFISRIPESDLRQFLAELILENEQIRNQLLLRYAFDADSVQERDAQMTALKEEVRDIIAGYESIGRYLDERSAGDLTVALSMFLDRTIPRLMEHACYREAFDLTIFVFIEVGSADLNGIADVGDSVAKTCFDYWCEMMERCPAEDQEYMKAWFGEEHVPEEVDSLMQMYVNEFYEEYCLTPPELRQCISNIDQLIADHQQRGEDDPPRIYSPRHGFQDAYALRIHFMKKLNLSEEEIRDYVQMHWGCFSVREFELKQAMGMGDYERAIELLREGKVLDAQRKEHVRKHSHDLIDLYRETGRMQEYQEELLFSLTHCSPYGLEQFKALKEMITDPEEWAAMREQILENNKYWGFQCEVFEFEGMYEELMATVEQNYDSLLTNRYADVLGEHFPERMIQVYVQYVTEHVADAHERRSYQYLTRYLAKVAALPGGKSTAVKIADQWRVTYRRRPALIDELKKVGL